jgi:CotH kinase protein
MGAFGSGGRWVLVLAVLAFAALLAPVAAGADEAEQIYRPDAVVEIDLGLSGEAEEALEDEPFEDVAATFTARLTDGTPGGPTVSLASGHPVEVRLKGNVTGSFRPFQTGKSAFKLKFAKTERFLGLRKMTLNNMVEDPSMLHETLSYGLFRRLGVPAPRSGFAYLRVNGEDFGTYLNLESIDGVALERLYPSAGTLHLYEGEYGTDVDAAGVPGYEMDEGDEPRSDLESLAAAVAATSPSFSQRLAGPADLEEMTRMWAVEKYVSQWDGYSGKEGVSLPNNYYLHSDLAGVFQMLPWGTDLSWQTDERIGFDGAGGLLFNGCYSDPACKALFLAALEEAQDAVGELDPEALATAGAALLKPWQELEAVESARTEHSLAKIDAEVADVHRYIAERPGELSAWLQTVKPSAPAAPLPTLTPPLSSPKSSPLPAPPAPKPSLEGLAVVRHRHSFTIRLAVSAPGRISGRATLREPDGDQTVCFDRADAEAAGAVALRCDLSAVAQRRLTRRWIRFPFSARLRSSDGQVADFATAIRMPRRK